MSFNSPIGQLKRSTNRHPLECFTAEIFFDIFRMSTLYFAGSLIKIKILLSTIFFKIFLEKWSDNDIVLTTQLVSSSRILLVDYKLLI